MLWKNGDILKKLNISTYDEGLRYDLKKIKEKAKSPLYKRTARELETLSTDLAERLGMTPLGVGYAVTRGGIIARQNYYQLID